MARSRSDSGAASILVVIILAVVTWYAYKQGHLKSFIDWLKKGQTTATTPTGPGTTAAGTCPPTIYKGTGKVTQTKKEGPKTRHYASGKPDDTSTEWNCSHPYKNFEFTTYLTITKIDHEDTVSMKYGGTHMGSGWYDSGVSFNGGQGCLGKEESHPSTDLCVIK